MTLPQQLEPFTLQDNPQVTVALKYGKLPYTTQQGNWCDPFYYPSPAFHSMCGPLGPLPLRFTLQDNPQVTVALKYGKLPYTTQQGN